MTKKSNVIQFPINSAREHFDINLPSSKFVLITVDGEIITSIDDKFEMLSLLSKGIGVVADLIQDDIEYFGPDDAG